MSSGYPGGKTVCGAGIRPRRYCSSCQRMLVVKPRPLARFLPALTKKAPSMSMNEGSYSVTNATSVAPSTSAHSASTRAEPAAALSASRTRLAPPVIPPSGMPAGITHPEKQRLAGDESAFLPEIEVDHVGHVFERAQPGDGLARQQAVDLLLRHRADQVRLDRHRPQSVHGDAEGGELAGQHLGQREDRSLGGDVDPLALELQRARDRREVDDAAIPVRLHQLRRL